MRTRLLQLPPLKILLEEVKDLMSKVVKSLDPTLAAGAWNPAEENATKAQTKGLELSKTQTRLAQKEGINSSRAHPPTEGKALVNGPGCSRLRFLPSY